SLSRAASALAASPMTNSKQNNACPHLRSRNAVNLLLFLVPTLRSQEFLSNTAFPTVSHEGFRCNCSRRAVVIHFQSAVRPMIGKDSSVISNPSGILRVNSVRDLSQTEPLPARRRQK